MFVFGSNAAGGYDLTDSVRFRASASAYLERTPTTAGNRKTWTWSAWVKRGKIDVLRVFSAATSSSNETTIYFDSNNKLGFVSFIGSENTRLVTTQVFRDPSAWYHIMVVVDTTQATSSNRIKIYVNGNQITAFDTATYPSQNYDTLINSIISHYYSSYDASYHFDGYMTEVNFVDGQALTPSDFGETDTITGVWKPKEYTGTYGTNGFYLPMKETQQATGFNTVLWAGNGGTQSITGVGFSPDLVWIKNRDVNYAPQVFDTVRGATNVVFTDRTNAESTDAQKLQSFDANGFTYGTNVGGNESGSDHVAWCWDAGSSTVSNTDGTITSSVRANPATGFSIVTYTVSSDTTMEIGHGLGSAPKVILEKRRDSSANWDVYHESTGNTGRLILNSTSAFDTQSGVWANTTPTSSVFYQSGNNAWHSVGATCVAYCFSEVAGYSKFGSYTGNGSSQTVNVGFRPAFILRKASSGGTDNWTIWDSDRYNYDKELYPNLSNAETNGLGVDITDTGFTLTSSNYNESGWTYIYMAFADTRDAQFNFDASGNKNNWTANNINSNASSETTYDIMNDVPTLTDEDTANFTTLNPLSGSTLPSFSDANLKVTGTGADAGVFQSSYSTIGMTAGKWYAEFTWLASGSNTSQVGVSSYVYPRNSSNQNGYINGSTMINLDNSTATSRAVVENGTVLTGGDASFSFSVNDIIGIAFDADSQTVSFYKNGSILGSTYPYDISSVGDGIFYFVTYTRVNSGASSFAANFGQRPFKYTPPTGYKKLNTYNLPDSTIKDGSQYFDAVTYTGNGTSQDITMDFSPDLVWIKERSSTSSHRLYDTIRDVNNYLQSSSTDAEGTNAGNGLTVFNSDGFSVGSNTAVNQSGISHISWSWRGSDSSAVSNTDGTITSTVSANTDSGFSVVTYTGNNTSGSTVGHGLGVAPSMVICKNRTAGYGSGSWATWHTGLSGGNYYLFLNSTAAQASGNNNFTAAPTNTVLNLGVSDTNNTADMVAYCFAEVEGFSKFGSYTGNGSTDGTFIYTGFRPAFVIQKRTNAAAGWVTQDTARNTYNVSDKVLFPHSSAAENTGTYLIDAVSNGFKLRDSASATNASGDTYIYMAFAENPFKQSLAR